MPPLKVTHGDHVLDFSCLYFKIQQGVRHPRSSLAVPESAANKHAFGGEDLTGGRSLNFPIVSLIKLVWGAGNDITHSLWFCIERAERHF